jgi:hypothetical protein
MEQSTPATRLADLARSWIADARPEPDLQHLLARLYIEQADHGAGKRSIGPRQDGAAQLAEYTRRTAEHGIKLLSSTVIGLVYTRGCMVRRFSDSPQWVALPSVIQVLPKSVLAKLARPESSLAD